MGRVARGNEPAGSCVWPAPPVDVAEAAHTRLPLVDNRARRAQGLVPWDGRAMGELEVRGPWVAAAYYKGEEEDGRFTGDGWFKTGDIVTIDPAGRWRSRIVRKTSSRRKGSMARRPAGLVRALGAQTADLPPSVQ